MSLRSAALLAAISLLTACASTPPPPPAPPAKVESAIPNAAPPMLERELSGALRGVPAGAEVELALLLLDGQDHPGRLLTSATLKGNGALLPFRLTFNPEAFPPQGRVELRGRVTQAGALILRLPSLPIRSADSQALGELDLEPAP
ncbi:MAG: YbaY family lipoprotein [Pseudomonas sp.]|uniref:YbaY family lipoprotein n=1 Tax=Pseudomonas sp. TaxID=306 RepID=UPI0033958647